MSDGYPHDWEADVVLRDGSTCLIRPILPTDAAELRRFVAELSEETVYLRFFSPNPALSERDFDRMANVDYVDSVALLALVAGRIIGVARYERIAPDEADIAFVVSDAHQSRGIGSVFLEHLMAAARERGIRTFRADVLPQNTRMMSVFEEAGYVPSTAVSDGIIHLTLDLGVTEAAQVVMESREHRAESRSVERLLTPSSVLVIGASRRSDSVGQVLLRNLLDSGFGGRVAAVNRHSDDDVCGVPTYRAVSDVPGQFDLAVVAVPAPDVPDVVTAAAAKGVHGLVVVSAGFAEAGATGQLRQRDLVHLSRALGMRLLGPNCLGLINTDPEVSLNASLSPVMPWHGRIGFFSQSGALGAALLEALITRGLGVSTFVSAGNRADVSANDLLQYWEEDSATDLVLLYLESIGNPRKFTRIARRLSRSTPVVATRTGRSTQGIPLGYSVRSSELPPAAVDQMFEQAGVIQVDSLPDMFDVAALLSFQPLPEGDSVAVIGNSDALGVLASDALTFHGLRPVAEPVNLGAHATPADYQQALAGALDDPAVDAVLTVYVPAVTSVGLEFAEVLAHASSRATKPVLATFLAVAGAAEAMRQGDSGQPGFGTVPTFPSVEEAARSLAAVSRYARWRRTPAGRQLRPAGIDAGQGRRAVAGALADRPEGGLLDGQALTALLLAYGVEVWPTIPVRTEAEAIAAAERLGWPAVLKSLAPALRARTDLGAVRLDLPSAAAMRFAYAEMVRDLGPRVTDDLVVQRMARRGVACRVHAVEDPLFGPVVGFSLGGVTADLTDDWAYRIPPLTDLDAADLVRAPKAAPLLFGHGGAEPTDAASLQDLVLRISALKDDLPEVTRLVLDPVVVSPRGLAVLGARVRVAPAQARTDPQVRRLEG